jgi:hypothetical protein
MYTGGISCKRAALCARSQSFARRGLSVSTSADKKGRRTKSSVYQKTLSFQCKYCLGALHLHLIRNLSHSRAASFSLNLKRTCSEIGAGTIFGTQPLHQLDIYTFAPRVYYLRAALGRINSYARHREWKMKRLFWNVHTIPSLALAIALSCCIYYLHTGSSLYSIASPPYLHWHKITWDQICGSFLFVAARAAGDLITKKKNTTRVNILATRDMVGNWSSINISINM